MNNFKKFPSIDQFRNAINTVKKQSKANDFYELPVIEFNGEVKIHGTNAGIGYNPLTKDIWAQSRNNIITPESDNAGFASWLHDNQKEIKSSLELECSVQGITDNVYVFGEWCGGNIQKGVGISGLDKMFIMFNVFVNNEWLSSKSRIPKGIQAMVKSAYCSYVFGEYKISIDFNKPEYSTDILSKLTEQVENECPVAKHFGISNGVGEGIVWKALYQDSILMFKVKGKKHSVSKVKTLSPVDIEKLNSIDEFVEYSVTENRLTQGINELGFGDELTKNSTGDFVRWIANDIIKEESDVLDGNGLAWKDVGSRVSKKASKWFLDQL